MEIWIGPIKGSAQDRINQLLTVYQSVHINCFILPVNDMKNFDCFQTQSLSVTVFCSWICIGARWQHYLYAGPVNWTPMTAPAVFAWTFPADYQLSFGWACYQSSIPTEKKFFWKRLGYKLQMFLIMGLLLVSSSNHMLMRCLSP